jgi:hypothetical protein
MQEENRVARRVPVGLKVLAALGLAASAAVAQPSPPVKQLPPGFTVVPSPSQPWLPPVMMAAVKPNTTKPVIAVAADVHISFTWQPSPGAARVVEMIAAAPEDPESGDLTKIEPAGKSRFSGSVLTFRKHTVVAVGTNGPPRVTYSGIWVAAVDGGMLTISVSNYAGPKADIRPWIDALIPARRPT